MEEVVYSDGEPARSAPPTPSLCCSIPHDCKRLRQRPTLVWLNAVLLK